MVKSLFVKEIRQVWSPGCDHQPFNWSDARQCGHLTMTRPAQRGGKSLRMRSHFSQPPLQHTEQPKNGGAPQTLSFQNPNPGSNQNANAWNKPQLNGQAQQFVPSQAQAPALPPPPPDNTALLIK
eukprot:570614-Rhodomonas_salina.1